LDEDLSGMLIPVILYAVVILAMFRGAIGSKAAGLAVMSTCIFTQFLIVIGYIKPFELR
jgi:hypothetical protein